MSQAEDLLNSLSENDISTKTEPHIVVGSNRVITVPSELKRIAVQYDHNIETVTFDCPRYWDDHDMSTMKVYINYTRADNEPGCYIADDVAVDETDTSIMHFSWTISRHVTEAVGPLTILVCIKRVDSDGNEVNHWNSERNTDMTISQGMECGDIIVNKYPDVITYLLEDMGNLADLTTEDKSSLVAAINEAQQLGLTATTPGQIIKVKTVDEQGSPTAWEAVDMPSRDKWEKIKEITIAEGAEESNALTINADENGNTFRLKKARLCAKFPAYTGTSTIPNFSFAMINGKATGRITPLMYTSAWPKISTKLITGNIYYVDVSGAQQIEHAQLNGNGGWGDDTTRDYRIYGGFSDPLRTIYGDTLWAKPITSIGGTGMLIYPGCHFVLYGVRE